MSEDELERIIGKRRKLRELERAREHVRRLERELCGERVGAQESEYIPEFLCVRAVGARIERQRADGERSLSPDDHCFARFR